MFIYIDEIYWFNSWITLCTMNILEFIKYYAEELFQCLLLTMPQWASILIKEQVNYKSPSISWLKHDKLYSYYISHKEWNACSWLVETFLQVGGPRYFHVKTTIFITCLSKSLFVCFKPVKEETAWGLCVSGWCFIRQDWMCNPKNSPISH